MSIVRFTSFDERGWPDCPNCEDGELFKIGKLDFKDNPSVEEMIAAGLECYECEWKPEPTDVIEHDRTQLQKIQISFKIGTQLPRY